MSTHAKVRREGEDSQKKQNMNKNLEADEKRQVPPPPPPQIRRNKQHRYNGGGGLGLTVIDIFSRPLCYCIVLLITSFFLGYISHSHSAPHPLPILNNNNNNNNNTNNNNNDNDNDNNDSSAHNTFPQRCAAAVPPDRVRQTILDKVFGGASPWEGFPPPHAAALLVENWNKGWGSRAAVFERLIGEVRPKTIIEVGTFLGASATHMAALAPPETQIVCIDDFRGWPGYVDEENRRRVGMVNGDSMLLYQFMSNVARANATDRIVFLPFSTGTALGGLCEWGVYGDLVEIDAAHDFHSAWVDINNAYKVLRKPGGVMFGHDYVWPGVRTAVHIFARLHNFRVKKDGEHWVLY
ncbi:uncharacterized protein LOC127261044 [Andrographis paniculata]|uniref:uncharacterized protein LOC127261044 n=1 Tax=Andrographis paniculata TaxID=175694 RepID=UPI0021E9101C|nr:uncharacterized protein LOC127261044 [Andrographis paniculata]